MKSTHFICKYSDILRFAKRLLKDWSFHIAQEPITNTTPKTAADTIDTDFDLTGQHGVLNGQEYVIIKAKYDGFSFRSVSE